MSKMPSPQSILSSPDMRESAMIMATALMEIRRKGIYYSDNHLKETVHEMERIADKAITAAYNIVKD